MKKNGSAALLLLALWGPVASGCAGEGGDGARGITEGRVTDSAGVRVVEVRVPDGVVPAYARVAGEPSLTLPRPTEGVPGWSSPSIQGAVTLSDGRVAVADRGSYRIRYYEGDSLTFSFGGRGQGPGRFLGISGMGPAVGDTVWIADEESHELTLLGPGLSRGLDPAPGTGVGASRGARLEWRLPVDGAVVGRFGDGSFLLMRVEASEEGEEGSVGVVRDPVDYLRWWPRTGDTSFVATFPGIERVTLETASRGRLTLPRPLARGTSLAVGPGRIYVGDQEHAEVLGLDPDGTLRQVIRLDGLDRTVTPELLSGFTVVDETGQEPEWAEDFWSRAPEVRPAFGRLILDAVGHLWVAEHTVGDAPPRSWLVFSPEGRLRGRVEVPEDLALLEIGASHLLGVVGSSQEVRRYALDRQER